MSMSPECDKPAPEEASRRLRKVGRFASDLDNIVAKALDEDPDRRYGKALAA